MSEEMYPQELIDEYYNAIQELHEALDDKDQQITDLQHEKEVIQKALELACKELRDDTCMRCDSCNSCNRLEMCDYVLSLYPTSYFIEQAKEMLENE